MSGFIVVTYLNKKLPQHIKKHFEQMKQKCVFFPVLELADVLTQHSPDVIVLYAESNVAEGSARVLDDVSAYDENLPVIILGENFSLEDAVKVMRDGASDFFPLPLDETRFDLALASALRIYTLRKQVFLLESQVGFRTGLDNIIGKCPKMQEIFNMTQMVAKSNATVLIQGESGTGKELIAKAIHNHSSRVKQTFLDINCGAIPRELLENEMFGHERGAYTGADKRYIGSVERANNGTLFLDEISEMDASLQVKLLRFLQERTFTRIGGNQAIHVDVRIVAATNRNLLEDVKNGKFREDLYYRLNVVPIFLPPLKERKEDIPLLAKNFLTKFATKNNKIFIDFSQEALEALVNHDWPGNVRELENTIERIVVLGNDSHVRLKHLPPAMQVQGSKSSENGIFPVSLEESGKILPLDVVERYAIESALRLCLGNVSEAASKLKIGQATLYRKIKQYGLRHG